MSLTLELSDRFNQDDANSIRAALNPHLQVRSVAFFARRSVDPPSVIQLLGDVVAWLPLTAPAAVFLSTLAKRAANAVWDKTAAWFAHKDVKPLADVATTLVAAADRVGGKVMIGVGLNIPDDHFGTVIWTDSRDPVEVARKLSAFIVRAERIAATVRNEIERGREPVGPFLVELERDGTVTIRWRAASDFTAYEQRIP